MWSNAVARQARAWAKPCAIAAAVAVGSCLAMTAIFAFFVFHENDSPLWWPVTAGVVVVMVHSPRRWWFALVSGMVVGVLSAGVGEVGWSLAVVYAVVNAVEVVVAAVVLVDARIPAFHEATRLLSAGAAGVAAGSVVIGVCSALISGGPPYNVLIGYSVTHALGFLALAPLLLPRRPRGDWRRASVAEFAGVLLAVTLLAWWALLQPDSDGRAFVMLVPVMWSAVRFDVVRTTVVACMTCAVAAFATAHERGPLAGSDVAAQREMLTQVFILAVTASTIGLVLVTRHRIQLATQARDSEQTLKIAIRDALIGMYSIWLDPVRFGAIRDVNNALCDLLGYTPEQLVGQHCDILGARGDPVATAVLRRHLERFADRSMTTLREESTFHTAGGDERWVELNLSVVESVNESAFVLVHVHDLTDRVRAQRSLERMALHDPLTGLANRTLLFRRIAAEFETARDGRSTVGLLYLDLDGFKEVNDTHGHDAGDAVLVAVARRLVGSVRRDSTVARLGGDEFAILCPMRAGDEELAAVADRLRRRLREPIHIDGASGPIAASIDVSIGVASVGAGGGADDLIRAADQAMYAVKQSRRPDPGGLVPAG